MVNPPIPFQVIDASELFVQDAEDAAFPVHEMAAPLLFVHVRPGGVIGAEVVTEAEPLSSVTVSGWTEAALYCTIP